MTATVTEVTDSVTPVTVIVISSRFPHSRHGCCDSVTVCGVTVCCVVTVCVVTVVAWFAVTVVLWCAAGGSTVTGVTTTRGDRDSNCDRGDGFRHPSHSFRNLVTVVVIPSRFVVRRFVV